MNLSAIDLNLLLMLHVVLEERSVTRAARRLHVTPPAISNALARLRAQLDDPLLVRSGRGLVATPRALELAPRLARAVGDLTLVVQGGESDPAESARELTLALADPDQIATLPRIVPTFAERLPRARLRVVSIDTLISTGGLAGGEIDAAIGPAEAANGLHTAPLYEEAGVLVARCGHPILRGKMTSERFRALRHVDVHLALGRGGVGHRVAEDALSRGGLARDIVVTVPTFTAAAMVVAQSDLVAGIPRRIAEALAPRLELVIMPIPIPAMRFEMQLLWHDRTHHDAVAARFRAAVIDAARPKKKRRGA
ncbi:LysR family transcriptional regulator [Sandaracinus amylolyticus]|uniref:LysR family transcriptional regulator n=1 Tax=Sandaracinus amylolyticus TaxID=927083 RepID=UPI001F2088D0|nr:LysR family transcriptional regulator [Sandaracinus amylolyticus]